MEETWRSTSTKNTHVVNELPYGSKNNRARQNNENPRRDIIKRKRVVNNIRKLCTVIETAHPKENNSNNNRRINRKINPKSSVITTKGTREPCPDQNHRHVKTRKPEEKTVQHRVTNRYDANRGKAEPQSPIQEMGLTDKSLEFQACVKFIEAI